MARTLIQLVEDDVAQRGALTRLLESEDHAVRPYGSDSKLVGAADGMGDRYDQVEVNLPGSDGFAVQRDRLGRGIGAPVVLMSGSGDPTLPKLKAGAAEFNQEPLGRGELLSVLAQIAQHRQSHG